MCFDPYSEQEHMRRFAVWAAARAAGRGIQNATHTNFNNALNGFDFGIQLCATQDEFDELYTARISAFSGLLIRCGVSRNRAFGAAAKFLNVYSKVIHFSIGEIENSFSNGNEKFAHPPIDRILMKKARECAQQAHRDIEIPPTIGWTYFDQQSYSAEISFLRELLGQERELWRIEALWGAQQ